MQVTTDFDKPLEEDIIFEETEELLSLENTIKHSENIMKSFLYLKKMFSSSPMLNRIVKVSTVDNLEFETFSVHEDANIIMIKNLSNQEFKATIDGGELVLLPFETFDFPIAGILEIKFFGRASIVQSEYVIG